MQPNHPKSDRLLAQLSPLTAAEIHKLLPSQEDKKCFAAILQIVNSAASKNNKVAALRKNFAQLGGVMVKVLGKYLKPV